MSEHVRGTGNSVASFVESVSIIGIGQMQVGMSQSETRV
jgi:hypothetical protein